MEAWLTRAEARGLVVRVPASQVQHGVFCIAQENAWYMDGVAFDWSALHARLGTDAHTSLLSPHVDALRAFGLAQLRRRGAARCSVTVIEVTAPWEVQPLSRQAQQLSVFSTASGRCSGSSSDKDAVADLTFYRFARGPPGVRGVVRDVTTALQGVAAQLHGDALSSSSSLCVLYCFSCFVVCSDDFATLLHHTAAVHKALKSCGLVLDMHRSSLVPQRIFAVHDDNNDDNDDDTRRASHSEHDDADVMDAVGWCVLPPHALTADDDLWPFVADLFFQWLHDAHYWGCHAPVRLYAPLPGTSDRNNDDNSNNNNNSDDGMAVRRACACAHFVLVVVLPRAHRAGLSLLRTRLCDTACGDGDDASSRQRQRLQQRLLPLVQRPRVLCGPQKWTALDVRLTLCLLDAYAHEPHAVLRDMPRHDAAS